MVKTAKYLKKNNANIKEGLKHVHVTPGHVTTHLVVISQPPYCQIQNLTHE